MLHAERPGETVVSSAEVSDPWGKDYSCPDCDHETHFVKAHLRDIGDEEVFVMAYFRHNPVPGGAGPDHDTADCSVAEHSEHERMRIIAFEMLKERCANGSSKVPNDFPAHVAAGMDTGPQGGSKTKAIGGRHPDAYIEFEDASTEYGNGIVLEVQYKNTNKDIKEVTRNFTEAGYSILWTRPKDYTDTGHGVELGDIITPEIDYPFVDEFRDKGWLSLFTAQGSAAFGLRGDDTAAIEPLIRGMETTGATFPLYWFTETVATALADENQPETTDRQNPSSTSYRSKLAFETSENVDNLLKLETGVSRRETQCKACPDDGEVLIKPQVDRATQGDQILLCDTCGAAYIREMESYPHRSRLLLEDYGDLADWILDIRFQKAKILAPLSAVKISNRPHQRVPRPRQEDREDAAEYVTIKGPRSHPETDPSKRIRYTGSSKSGERVLYIPEDAVDDLGGLSNHTVRIHKPKGYRSGLYRVSDYRYEWLTEMRAKKLTLKGV